jgi:hypothetical protein
MTMMRNISSHSVASVSCGTGLYIHTLIFNERMRADGSYSSWHNTCQRTNKRAIYKKYDMSQHFRGGRGKPTTITDNGSSLTARQAAMGRTTDTR